jgi:hypothetical protein
MPTNHILLLLFLVCYQRGIPISGSSTPEIQKAIYSTGNRCLLPCSAYYIAQTIVVWIPKEHQAPNADQTINFDVI